LIIFSDFDNFLPRFLPTPRLPDLKSLIYVKTQIFHPLPWNFSLFDVLCSSSCSPGIVITDCMDDTWQYGHCIFWFITSHSKPGELTFLGYMTMCIVYLSTA
jgi:hypothetical protein